MLYACEQFSLMDRIHPTPGLLGRYRLIMWSFTVLCGVLVRNMKMKVSSVETVRIFIRIYCCCTPSFGNETMPFTLDPSEVCKVRRGFDERVWDLCLCSWRRLSMRIQGVSSEFRGNRSQPQHIFLNGFNPTCLRDESAWIRFRV